MIKILLPTLDRFFFTGNMKALMGLEVSSNFVFNQKFIKNNEFFYSGLGESCFMNSLVPHILNQLLSHSLSISARDINGYLLSIILIYTDIFY